MFAIISDIHANAEAARAVFEDIDQLDIRTVYCLGDVVGYGASPREAVDLLLERSVTSLSGNHDHAVLYEPGNFNISAERAAYWTRQLFEDESNKADRDRRWEFLGHMPVKVEYDGLLMVHGSPRRPVNEYLFPEDIYTNPGKIVSSFERLGNHRACFVGHTHVPGVFLDDPYFDSPRELTPIDLYEIVDDEKAIINVGSVGQPRDRDVRASYVVIHEPEDPCPIEAPPLRPSPRGRTVVEFRRVEYDIESAANKVFACSELDDFLGHRLFEGR